MTASAATGVRGVLIVADNASADMGGEAVLPLHYFRGLRRAGIPAWLVVHERVSDELHRRLDPDELAHVRFTGDTAAHRILWRFGRILPARLHYFTLGFVMRMLTQVTQRRVARELIGAESIDVVHQPTPVSPTEPSLLHDLGAPVVIGPMNGGMEYPAGITPRGVNATTDRLSRLTRAGGRSVATVFNRLLPGKRRAALLLVANPRTRSALPSGLTVPVGELVENGVDLDLWREPRGERTSSPSGSLRLVFVGRLVDWKAVDVVIEALGRVSVTGTVSLDIVGDGPERDHLEALVSELRDQASRFRHTVEFHGWLPQESCAERVADADALVLPSILECGGAVVLEAMAVAKPVIATRWGGPADYLDETCGILVDPTSRPGLVDGLARAIEALAADPDLRSELGRVGRLKVESDYDWSIKIERIVECYQRVIDRR